METKNILFISGSVGLGHVTRDLAIANTLRKMEPNIKISWIAVPPASDYLKEHNETIHPNAKLFANDNIPIENAVKSGFQLNLLDYLMKAKDEWKKNVHAFINIINKELFDLVIGDETYEISIAFKENLIKKDIPYIVLYDFYGMAVTSRNPMERFGTWMWNRVWIKNPEFWDGKNHLPLLLGEQEDIPDDRMGFLLPKRREFASRICKFVGNVLTFDPQDYKDKKAVRKKLGYGEKPLIICSAGSTAAGKDLLTLCGHAYPIIKNKIPDIHFVIVGGPRLSPDELNLPEGIETRTYVPALYEHFAACDLAIVHGGYTSTLELTALNKPFLYFPLERHFEQQLHVAYRLERHRAGVKMVYSKTTPELLTEKIVENLGKKVDYAHLATDGAKNVVKYILALLAN